MIANILLVSLAFLFIIVITKPEKVVEPKVNQLDLLASDQHPSVRTILKKKP